MEITERIALLLTEKYTTDEAFADCFTVEIEFKPGNKLYVFADSDSGMTFEKCQKISRFLESHIDEQGWLGEKYVLEVSSPGISRPLKFARQYAKNIGRAMEITLPDKSLVEGRLVSADEENIVLTYEVVEKDGKKKIKTQIEKTIPYSNIEKAIVKIAF